MVQGISDRIDLAAGTTRGASRALTAEAMEFVARLQRRFNPRREQLLRLRSERQAELDSGVKPDFLPETAAVRDGDWRVATAPPALLDRRVEITGPVDRKMMINALNSGASVFMADFEDSLSPTWENVVTGQENLMDAARGTLSFTSPEGREYRLAERTATLLVRPRGWHLLERHAFVDGEAVSASLFDFGIYFFHNARALLASGAGPYFYLPKLESHLEARLWNDVFIAAQEEIGLPRGTIRATVLIETILAAFEMEEILYELREHSSGLNAGRWDYIFSIIKKFRNAPEMMLPDRARVTMTVPFMRSYTNLLVRACHKRGAHAIGGMAAFIPSRRDPEVNEAALANVRDDKLRESRDGFDGTWVAHPDLVPVAREVFDSVLGERPNQIDRDRSDVRVDASDILDVRVADGRVTLDGVRNNVSVALQYLESWLRGWGAVGINNLMEDTATAEISRAQLWQWIRNAAPLAVGEGEGETMTADVYREVRDRELEVLEGVGKGEGGDAAAGRYAAAVELLDALVLGDSFTEFLTIPGSRYLELEEARQGARP